jgi:hypothetical protein
MAKQITIRDVYVQKRRRECLNLLTSKENHSKKMEKKKKSKSNHLKQNDKKDGFARGGPGR